MMSFYIQTLFAGDPELISEILKVTPIPIPKGAFCLLPLYHLTIVSHQQYKDYFK